MHAAAESAHAFAYMPLAAVNGQQFDAWVSRLGDLCLGCQLLQSVRERNMGRKRGPAGLCFQLSENSIGMRKFTHIAEAHNFPASLHVASLRRVVPVPWDAK